ncbi:B12-binding domain-containing radical SAM protein [Plantactinospora sp. WMMB334]|uniref:B12-binding domain-containing radical SAM protein n=1 Tax=Plantactinospora sp. WMMB334 TaxID=3404119 RepID=UPI003B958416
MVAAPAPSPGPVPVGTGPGRAVGRNPRRVLAVSPRYARSFGTLDHAFPLVGAAAFMPPQGLLTIAGYLPACWQIRFVDENLRDVTDRELAWAEVVLLSGMHVQREQIQRLAARARASGCVTVLGGPSVSASPELYPSVDLLHVGELGDATDALVARLDADPRPPPEQQVYVTGERHPLERFPIPRYDLIDLPKYLLGSVQFSSGCPFRCEFCDIPTLYGQRPRRKSVAAVLGELEAMLDRGNPGTVYFVDDNFIADPRAAVELLTALVRWQRAREYPVSFACEATMNLAKRTDILELMREASFTTVFMGVESPDRDALRAMRKTQNLATPLLETVHRLNRYGLEVVAGMIMGLDGDDPGTGRRILEFVEASQIPMLTINLLHALPRTPLWDRLSAAGRIRHDAGDRESNVDFLLPYDDVVRDWRSTVTRAFTPEAVYRRFGHQLRHTYPHRLRPRRQRPGRAQLLRGLGVVGRTLWHLGIRGSYRRVFWRTAWPLLRTGRVEKLVHVATVSHHLITFARDVAAGRAEKCFYNPGGGPPGAGSVGAGPVGPELREPEYQA